MTVFSTFLWTKSYHRCLGLQDNLLPWMDDGWKSHIYVNSSFFWQFGNGKFWWNFSITEVGIGNDCVPWSGRRSCVRWTLFGACGLWTERNKIFGLFQKKFDQSHTRACAYFDGYGSRNEADKDQWGTGKNQFLDRKFSNGWWGHERFLKWAFENKAGFWPWKDL